MFKIRFLQVFDYLVAEEILSYENNGFLWTNINAPLQRNHIFATTVEYL